MNLELKGLTALVTGASRGIGFAVAQAFAREGCICIWQRAQRLISMPRARRYSPKAK